MSGRVYIPSAQVFGTVTGSHAHGMLASLRYLHVRLDRTGGEVAVLEDDVACPDNVAVFPVRRRFSPYPTDHNPGPCAA